MKAWITAPLAVKAPNNDLCLLKTLLHYKLVNETITSVTFKKLLRYLWYLSDELAGPSLFDDGVAQSVQDSTVQAMSSSEEKEVYI